MALIFQPWLSYTVIMTIWMRNQFQPCNANSHNLKEDDFKFTKNQLSKDAKTSGTSANNYVVGMERINLIKLVPEKKQGGSLYQVVDPKIKYAIANNLELQSS